MHKSLRYLLASFVIICLIGPPLFGLAIHDRLDNLIESTGTTVSNSPELNRAIPLTTIRYGFKAKIIKRTHGWFSSTIKVRISPRLGQKNVPKSKSSSMIAGDFDIDVKVYHGPFWFYQSATGERSFHFGLFGLSYSPLKSLSSNPLPQARIKQFVIHVDQSFGAKGRFNLSLYLAQSKQNPLKSNHVIANLIVKYRMDDSQDKKNIAIDFVRLTIPTLNYLGHDGIVISNLDYHSTLQFNQKLNLTLVHKQTLTVPSISLNSGQQMQFSDVQMHGVSDDNGKQIGSRYEFDIGNVTLSSGAISMNFGQHKLFIKMPYISYTDLTALTHLDHALYQPITMGSRTRLTSGLATKLDYLSALLKAYSGKLFELGYVIKAPGFDLNQNMTYQLPKSYLKKFSYGDQSIWCLHDASQYMDVNDAEQLLQDGQCLNVADKSDRQANKDIEQLSKSLFRQKGRLQLHLSYLLNCDNQKDKPVSAFYHSNVCQVFDAMLGPLKKWFIDDSEDGFRHLDISYEGAKLFVNGEIISLDALLGRGEYAEKDKMALDELEIDDSEHHDERADDIPAQYRD